MKESIGATWIFAICLTFIILFTAYVAISVNYAKAFRIKSHIVSEIEENEGLGGGDISQELETYLVAQGYATYGECEPYIEVEDQTTDWQLRECLMSNPSGKCGACIYRREVSTGNDDIEASRVYYRVRTFFNFDLPVVNVLIPEIKVSGDTQYIYERRADV